jgi:thiamine pyrophosphate-dependent acetolactate synthase large subunit-like protein
MGWGAIADDHPLMAGMVGLQTSHRYGNATLLASDFVLGIGNRWANRHTGPSMSSPRAASSSTSISSRPRSAASSGRITASSPTPGRAEAVRRGG